MSTKILYDINGFPNSDLEEDVVVTFRSSIFSEQDLGYVSDLIKNALQTYFYNSRISAFVLEKNDTNLEENEGVN